MQFDIVVIRTHFFAAKKIDVYYKNTFHTWTIASLSMIHGFDLIRYILHYQRHHHCGYYYYYNYDYHY